VPPAHCSVYPEAEDEEHGGSHQRSKEEDQDERKSGGATPDQSAYHKAYDEPDDIDYQLQDADVDEHLAVVYRGGCRLRCIGDAGLRREYRRRPKDRTSARRSNWRGLGIAGFVPGENLTGAPGHEADNY
jgi:hypothetical protein